MVADRAVVAVLRATRGHRRTVIVNSRRGRRRARPARRVRLALHRAIWKPVAGAVARRARVADRTVVIVLRAARGRRRRSHCRWSRSPSRCAGWQWRRRRQVLLRRCRGGSSCGKCGLCAATAIAAAAGNIAAASGVQPPPLLDDLGGLDDEGGQGGRSGRNGIARVRAAVARLGGVRAPLAAERRTSGVAATRLLTSTARRGAGGPRAPLRHVARSGV